MKNNMETHRFHPLKSYFCYMLLGVISIVCSLYIIPEIVLLWNINYAHSILEDDCSSRTNKKGTHFMARLVVGILNLIFSNFLSLNIYLYSIRRNEYLWKLRFEDYGVNNELKCKISFSASIILFVTGLILHHYLEPKKAFVVWCIVNSIIALFAFVIWENHYGIM